MTEVRQYNRTKIDSNVYLSEFTIPNNEEDITGALVNISGGGVLLRCNNYFEVGTLLKLKIMIGGWDKYLPVYLRQDSADYTEPLVSLGTVRRVENKDDQFLIAVRFDAIDGSHQESLDKFIKEYSERS